MRGLVSGLLSRLRDRPALALPAAEVDAILARHGAEPWFSYANRRWSRRSHVRVPCQWLVERLARDAIVLETGCGCGLNLLWLGRRGLRRLIGVDVDGPALAAGRDLAERSGSTVRFVQGDARTPPPEVDGGIGALLALNWTYHVEEFDLAGFLGAWRGRLARGALVALDAIDRTAPAAGGGLTREYRRTATLEELERAAAAADLELAISARCAEEQPRIMALLRAR